MFTIPTSSWYCDIKCTYFQTIFRMPECAKAHVQQTRISEYFRDRTPDALLSGKGNAGRVGGRSGGRGGRRSPNKKLPLHHFVLCTLSSWSCSAAVKAAVCRWRHGHVMSSFVDSLASACWLSRVIFVHLLFCCMHLQARVVSRVCVMACVQTVLKQLKVCNSFLRLKVKF